MSTSIELALSVPSFSRDWYRTITDFAISTPSWLHSVADIGTEAGLLLFVVLFVAVWWRAREGNAYYMALALLAPMATIAAYAVSEISKSFLHEERPCRAVADVETIAHCPPIGDWSFPSNHATIAAASAAAVVVAWRRLALIALPAAALIAFSRVFVGVHYPHDVMAGFLVGVTVAPVFCLLLAGFVTAIVQKLRPHPQLGVLLIALRAKHHRPSTGRAVGVASVPQNRPNITQNSPSRATLNHDLDHKNR